MPLLASLVFKIAFSILVRVFTCFDPKLGHSAPIWVNLKQSGPFWTILGHFEPFRAILSHSKPCWDIPRQSEPDRAIQRSSSSPRPWRTSRKINQTRALGRREAPSAPKGPEGPLGPWGGPVGPPRALGWGVGGWGHAETRTSRKHERAETCTCRARRKQSRVDGNYPQGKTIDFWGRPCRSEN